MDKKKWILEDDGELIFISVEGSDEDLITITGPNRKANAKRFIATHHMDKLVKAAETLETNITDNDELRLSAVSSLALRKLRAILTKIGRS